LTDPLADTSHHLGIDERGELLPAGEGPALVHRFQRGRHGADAILDVLVERYPSSVDRQDLADLTGFTASGGTFVTYLGVLRRNGLIEVNGKSITASDTLFVGMVAS
jgi:hypothetical protein